MIAQNGPVLLFIVLLLMTLAIRIREKTWYSPFSFFGLLWTFIIGFSIFTAPEYFFSGASLAFITLCVFIFFAGGYVAENWRMQKSFIKQGTAGPGGKILALHFYIAVAAGFCSLYFLLHDSGIRFSEIAGFGQFMDASKVLTNQRYEGERLTGPTMICMTICYSGCLTGGHFFVFGKNKLHKASSLLVLLPLLLFTLVYTARSVFIFAVLFFIASVITNYLVLFRKDAQLFGRRNLLFMGIACIVLPMIFLFTQAIKMGISNFSPGSIGIVADHLKIYFSGNLSAFSYWFGNAGEGSRLSAGAYTFAGMNELLGGAPRELGIYGKAIDLDGHMNFSNIYTLFRFLIDDFGTGGTIIFWFLLGIGSRMMYGRVLSGDFVSAAVLSGIFTMMLFSFVTSVFAYNSVLFSWLFFVLVTFVAEKYNGASALSKLKPDIGEGRG